MPFDLTELDEPEAEHPMAVCFDRVTKEYRLYRNDRARFCSAFSSRVPYHVVKACDNVSFTIERGEAVAFIGDNGAGKSTILKLIAGVSHPTSGRVYVRGRIGAILELTAGFDMTLTGRENIAMRGSIFGMSTEQVEAVTPGIIEFAELGSYIDQPMRTYSSGMRARLGFAFVTAIHPDILIVDEALAVGDRNFAAKCIARVEEIIRTEGTTVLFVTHSSSMAREFCTRGIVLKKGRVEFDGYIIDAIRYYNEVY
jgi:teichoic acid transport system ATP-binding protein